MSRNRGKTAKTMYDITRKHRTYEEEIALLNRFTYCKDPLAAAILGVSMLEDELEYLIKPKFKRHEDMWDELTSENGPLNDFYSKVTAAYAFGIINNKDLDDLRLIRKIRNTFAHSKRIIDFGHPTLWDWVQKTSDTKVTKTMIKLYGRSDGALASYIFTCLRISMKLLRKHHARFHRQMKQAQRKTGETNPVTLAKLLFQPRPPAKPQASHPRPQSADPTPAKDGGILAALAGMGEDSKK